MPPLSTISLPARLTRIYKQTHADSLLARAISGPTKGVHFTAAPDSPPLPAGHTCHTRCGVPVPVARCAACRRRDHGAAAIDSLCLRRLSPDTGGNETATPSALASGGPNQPSASRPPPHSGASPEAPGYSGLCGRIFFLPSDPPDGTRACVCQPSAHQPASAVVARNRPSETHNHPACAYHGGERAAGRSARPTKGRAGWRRRGRQVERLRRRGAETERR